MHIGNRIAHLRQGVVLFDDLHVIELQVEGEGQTDMTHGDVHARLLRGHLCHLLHRPVLYRGQIDQHGEQ